MRISASLLLIVFGLVLTAAPPEWPQFRGPDSNPAVTAKNSLPEKWSKTENIEWSAEVPGRGWSSPVVVGNRIFLTSVTTDGKSKPPQIGTEYSNEYVAELMKQGLSEKEVMARVTARDIELPEEVNLHYLLHCLDLRTGKTLWKREFHTGKPPGGRHRKNSFASETPVTDGERVYVHITNLGLWAWDVEGKPLWKTPLEAFPIYLDFGTGASPALVDGKVIVVNDNEKQQFLAAFDAKTGKQLWRVNRDLSAGRGGPPMRSAWVTPYIWRTPARTEIVTVGPGAAVSYDTAGKELWRLEGVVPNPIPSPFATGGMLLVNGGKGKPIFAIRPGASGDAASSVAWKAERAGTYLSTQVAYGDALYTVSENGIFSRYDGKTGALSYRSRIEGGTAFTSSPWAYNGRVFCLDEEGRTHVISAGEKYERLAVNELDEMALATPAIVGDRLLLRTESHLWSIRDGSKRATP